MSTLNGLCQLLIIFIHWYRHWFNWNKQKKTHRDGTQINSCMKCDVCTVQCVKVTEPHIVLCTIVHKSNWQQFTRIRIFPKICAGTRANNTQQRHSSTENLQFSYCECRNNSSKTLFWDVVSRKHIELVSTFGLAVVINKLTQPPIKSEQLMQNWRELYVVIQVNKNKLILYSFNTHLQVRSYCLLNGKIHSD